MRIDIITVLPELLKSPFEASILKRAIESKLVEVCFHNLREYTNDNYKSVDDYQFGGGAGMVMLVIVLGQAGIPEAGLALIFAIDRPLDMCRTTVNVTGDASVSMIVAKMLGKLHEPKIKDWDDNYDQ